MYGHSLDDSITVPSDADVANKASSCIKIEGTLREALEDDENRNVRMTEALSVLESLKVSATT